MSRETGDLEIVREFYPAVAKYVDSVVLAAQMAGLANLYKRCVRFRRLAIVAACLRRPLSHVPPVLNTDHTFQLHNSYGDWCNLPGTPMCSPHMTGSFSLLENLQQVSALAEALGLEEDARVYGAYHGSFTKAFHGACEQRGGCL